MEDQNFEVLKKCFDGFSEIAVVTRAVLGVFKHLTESQPDHVKRRVISSLESARKYSKKLEQKDSLRNDWFSDTNIQTNLAEEIARQIINDAEGKKSEYIAKFYVNVRYTSNSDIDPQTAFQYLSTIDSLSWRQLCMISLIILDEQENSTVDVQHYMNNDSKLPQDKRSEFYSIGRDFQDLMSSNYITGVSPNTSDEYQPFLRSPSSGRSTGYIRRLYSLMNLHEISNKVLTKTFSIWGVSIKD